ncbi:PREDICTED: calcium-binding protein E63-1 [Nicrophorus vespilloides]|uniref:Calcium-binding protein E63-1 n=1 Tax=Nicrophorus vespilloides TaxID=110193 RepID=A0ABM1MLX3_NICVS|nr:PREDICTED: calcium-binding protein E63-1 [Nicrophorus vespilloides]
MSAMAKAINSKKCQAAVAAASRKDFTENELQDLRTAFGLIDSNQDGKLNKDELHLMMQKLGIDVRPNILEDLVRTASTTGNELLDETEFLQWVRKIQDLRPEEATDDHQKDLMAAFRVFDLDQNGYITRDELKTAMETIGEQVTEQQLSDFITMADTDKDGKINYEEFARLLL